MSRLSISPYFPPYALFQFLVYTYRVVIFLTSNLLVSYKERSRALVTTILAFYFSLGPLICLPNLELYYAFYSPRIYDMFLHLLLISLITRYLLFLSHKQSQITCFIVVRPLTYQYSSVSTLRIRYSVVRRHKQLVRYYTRMSASFLSRVSYIVSTQNPLISVVESQVYLLMLYTPITSTNLRYLKYLLIAFQTALSNKYRTSQFCLLSPYLPLGFIIQSRQQLASFYTSTLTSQSTSSFSTIPTYLGTYSRVIYPRLFSILYSFRRIASTIYQPNSRLETLIRSRAFQILVITIYFLVDKYI